MSEPQYVEAMRAEITRLRVVARAADAFEKKLTALQPAINAAFLIQQMHGMPYAGETYVAELLALREALAGVDMKTWRAGSS